MNTATLNAPSSMGTSASGFFARTEAWLDARGRTAWITAMVGGYIVFWPVGLAMTAYMVFNNKFSGSGGRKSCRRGGHTVHMNRSTGNAAFDTYKDETLRRLEDEQTNFEEFLERLREAKDKAEFDQFMNERGNQTKSGDDATATQ
ncbi:DUF2852 domain-containing protein [Yoonia sp.]|uniref:DUF2852 domain-containing protein n=1 Tax=Yoonia sp. TaxID=2212373 RepID=UPI0023836B5B|nr:DUF2852 domain-containing protein [Yoonia sp.]MDE0852403.1 DUF2852 domain-containing protein [Yoonia sp.]